MNQALTSRRLPAALALLCAALSALAPAAHAFQRGESPDRIWKELGDDITFATDALASVQETGPRLPPKEKRRFFRLNTNRLRNMLNTSGGRGRSRSGGSLSSAPAATAAAPPQAAASEVWLPMPDGGYARFMVEEAPIMEPELAAQFPSIKSYRGQGIDDPTLTVRFNLTDDGMFAIVLSPDRTYYIDPTPRRRGDETHLTVYRQDYPAGPSRSHCNVTDEGEPASEGRRAPRPTALSSGETRRTYRLAVAATGEYTKFHGQSVERARRVERAFQAIATTIARVNGIYERDLAITLVLVNGQRNIIYENPDTDPYTNGNDLIMQGENQRNLDRVIGPANYDIGHVFGTGDGGREIGRAHV
jgi:hypothetical protein